MPTVEPQHQLRIPNGIHEIATIAAAHAVAEGDRLIGMIADRDLALRAIAEGSRSPHESSRKSRRPDRGLD